MFTPEERATRAAIVQEQLRQLDGAGWRLVGYGTTHPSFVITVERADENGALKWSVSCAMPRHYCGPLGGVDCRFCISLDERGERSAFILFEERSGLKIRCISVNVSRRD